MPRNRWAGRSGIPTTAQRDLQLLLAEMRRAMETIPMSRSERFEYEETLRVLACLIFEIRVNWLEKVDEDPPGNIFDRLEAIIKYAPPAVQPLVEHLRRNPPQECAGELYTYTFPFIQWPCAEQLPTWEIAPLALRGPHEEYLHSSQESA